MCGLSVERLLPSREINLRGDTEIFSRLPDFMRRHMSAESALLRKKALKAEDCFLLRPDCSDKKAPVLPMKMT